MPTHLPHVFTPLAIGPVTVKNRLYMSAHTTFSERDSTGYNKWSVHGERAMHYYAERAKGGFGLITVGQLEVHPQAGSYRPGAWTPQAKRHFKSISDACHEHGAKVFVQLNQHGRLKGGSGSDDWAPMWAPSALPPDYHGLPHKIAGEMSKAMDKADMKFLKAAYARSALNALRGGIDGIEVHIGHTHLFSEFLMPAYNHRKDEYGGSLENRMRLVVETLESIRNECGRSIALGVRMNLEWPLPENAGLELADTIEIAMKLDETGLLDFISCTMFPGEMAMPTNRLPPGFQIPKAAAIKEAVKLPVLALGRIIDPQEAEKILAKGLVDMVGMTKAGIADPELPNKALEGKFDDIRPCIGAQQGCFLRIMQDKPLSCTQNPAVGLEKFWGAGTLKPAATKKRVLIVGGGPAGLEAALTAARRGHEVTLYEKEPVLGGQLNLVGKVALRDEMLGVVRWREGQVKKLGVQVHVSTTVTPELIKAQKPDVVIVATGATPRANAWYAPLPHLPHIPGSDLPHVFTYADVLLGRADGRKHIAIVDAIGFHQASDPLEYLVSRGCKVEAVTHYPQFAVDMLLVDRSLWLKSLRGKDLTFHDHTMVRAIGEDSLEVEDTVSGKRSRIEGLDAVVLAMGADVNDGLYQSLKGKVRNLHVIGDAFTPRRIEQAIHEGHKLGREI